MNDRRAQFVDNHDGDSVTMLLDQGFYDYKQINIRLANVWAPELRDPGGREVMNFVLAWFTSRMSKKVKWPFIVHTMMTTTQHEVQTLGRIVGTIMSKDGKESLNSDIMKFIVENGYTGGIGSISR